MDLCEALYDAIITRNDELIASLVEQIPFEEILEYTPPSSALLSTAFDFNCEYFIKYILAKLDYNNLEHLRYVYYVMLNGYDATAITYFYNLIPFDKFLEICGLPNMFNDNTLVGALWSSGEINKMRVLLECGVPCPEDVEFYFYVDDDVREQITALVEDYRSLSFVKPINIDAQY